MECQINKSQIKEIKDAYPETIVIMKDGTTYSVKMEYSKFMEEYYNGE